MKRFLVLVMTSILVVCLIAGCGRGIKAHTDPEKMISTSVNQEFVIAIESNPTTGYDWEVSYEDNMLSLVEQEYSEGKAFFACLQGTGGTQYFTFKALKKGNTEITLTYKRSWETDYAEQKVFNVDMK